MRGGGRIAKQHDILMAPSFTKHTVEIQPCRATQMAGIRHQLVAAKVAHEDFFAESYRFVDAHAVEAEAPPCRVRAFHYESRGVRIELIGVHPDPAVLGFFEDESECVIKFLVRAEPDVLAGTNVDVGLERTGICRAYP